MKNKFTPGPWEVDTNTGSNHVQIYSSIGTLVVDRIARGQRQPEDDNGKFSKLELANAQLISCAPDLLEALLAAKTTLEAFLPDAFETIRVVNNAILKARGL